MVTYNSFGDWQNYGDASTSMLDQMMSRIDNNTAAANAFNTQMAANQMAFQQASAREAMEFSHKEAELSRNWQEMMSNTAHQREVKDLLAAGLNPVLSATGGNGAPVTSGATAAGVTSSGSSASADTSANASLAGILGSFVQSATSRDIAELNAQVALKNYEISAAASKYSSDNLFGSVLAQLAHDSEMREMYPSGWYSTLTTLADVIANGGESNHPGISMFYQKLSPVMSEIYDRIYSKLGLDDKPLPLKSIAEGGKKTSSTFKSSSGSLRDVLTSFNVTRKRHKF